MDGIIKNIIGNKQFSTKSKFKNTLYYYARKRGAKKSWEKRHQKVFDWNSSYNTPCESDIESEHQMKWSSFSKEVDLSTLRICKNISGRADPRIIPEDIFVSDIEPTLVADESVHFLSHKSFYNRWFPDGVFPSDIFHNIDGQYLDSQLNPISFQELKRQAGSIVYPVVMKPNKDSFGGKDVFFIENVEDLINHCEKSDNFVVQEQLPQHAFFKKYNPVGLNTIRVYVYKSVKDNRPHILNMALRMGKGGSLDNLSTGGIQTMIRKDGSLNGYAVDKYGTKYAEHPDSGYSFDEMIPDLENMKELSLRIASQIHFTRIIGLDLCYAENSQWRLIEVNTKGHSIRFSQYGGQPFFGVFTDEVIDYCKKYHWALI
ncbi:MAG TPA: sugar-transfer associated ATP-grasp domain-containing protein [Chitinophagaceae bacterium]|nr:sugar-transfer associated ATP-grasp domain-containing protein [Chitinophagaceae bacterium]